VDEGAAMKKSLLSRGISLLAHGAKGLHQDEEGAALVFAAITLFSLALATFLVFQVGLVSTDRMQVQSAADAAAYSGAQVEANAINSIGQINDGMSYVHYTTLRHLVDSIVYSTLAEFGRHAEWVTINNSDKLFQQPIGATMPGIPTEFQSGIENQDAPGWVMLGDEAEWDRRWARVERQRGAQVIEAGKRWLLDLNAANRRILEAVPDLVREKAAEVAFRNGASHVAVSSDIEEVFRANADGSGDVGFVEAAGTEQDGSGDERVAAALAFRYAGAKDGYPGRSLSVEGEPRGFPEWFDAEIGRAKEPYSQVRLCWNVNDWAHRDRPGETHGEFGQWTECPNGHWHALHEHSYMDNTTDPPTMRVETHGGLQGGGGSVQEAQCMGGGAGGGHMMPFDDDPILHQKVKTSQPPVDPLAFDDHHAVVYCPTCYTNDADRSGEYSQIVKRQDLAEEHGAVVELGLTTGDFPKPLHIAPALLRSAVTVATWRDSHGVGDLLPRSEWGMIAVASAQIGYLDPQGVVQSPESLDTNEARYGGGMTVPLALNERMYRNLYYSADPQRGVRFGARLVPLAGELTHHPSLASGGAVDELLDPRTARERWWTTTDQERPAPSNMSQEAPTEALTALRRWVAVPGFDAVQRVFWH
jgi:hypothetical protein